MEFLINKFLQKLKTYKSFINYDWCYDNITESYIIRFYDLPLKLYAEIIKKKTDVPYTDGFLYKDNIASSIKEEDRSIKIFLDKDTYARKINYIDILLEHYISSTCFNN